MSVGMPVLFWKPHFLLYWRRLVKECIPIFGCYTFLFAILMIILRLHFFEVFGSFQTSCGIFFILFPFLSVLILVLLSAHIRRFSISRLWNFFIFAWFTVCHSILTRPCCRLSRPIGQNLKAASLRASFQAISKYLTDPV